MTKKTTSQQESGYPGISSIALKAISKLAEQGLKDSGDIEPGQYPVSGTFRVEATLIKGAPTSANERFDYGAVVRNIILLYANDVPDGVSWLRLLLHKDGRYMQLLCSDKSEAAIANIKPELLELWMKMEKDAKANIPLKKVPRAGNTTVVGTIEPVLNE